jgi:hypothetical protein
MQFKGLILKNVTCYVISFVLRELAKPASSRKPYGLNPKTIDSFCSQKAVRTLYKENAGRCSALPNAFAPKEQTHVYRGNM